jgi:hypothetical protein
MKKRGGSSTMPATVSIVTKTTIIGSIIAFISGIGSFLFSMAILAQAIFVVCMCIIVYMMIHYTLVAINFVIKLIRTILPFLKKKLKLIPEWPHTIILEMFGINLDESDEKDKSDVTKKSEENYCPIK